ncbi:MAG: hypothetical protein M1831_005171 [Alyxoria varia]|nr:MAG: hypothetical protein M1831_005171 [Alyxoria varia]
MIEPDSTTPDEIAAHGGLLSYYAPLFDQYQQKEVSGFLRVMWKEDPFKAKEVGAPREGLLCHS